MSLQNIAHSNGRCISFETLQKPAVFLVTLIAILFVKIEHQVPTGKEAYVSLGTNS